MMAAVRSAGADEGQSVPFRLLFVAGRTGPLALAVSGIERGIRAHVAWINDNGGLRDRQLDVIVRDNEGDPDKGARIIEAEIDRAVPDLVMPGVSSAEAVAAGPVLLRSRVVGISAATTPLLNDLDAFAYSFSSSVTQHPIMKGMAAFAASHPGPRTATLIASDDILGDSAEEYFVPAFEAEGFATSVHRFPGGAADVSTIFQDALSDRPGWIVMEGGVGHVGLLLASRVKAGAHRTRTIAATTIAGLAHLTGTPAELEGLSAALLPMQVFVEPEDRGPQFTALERELAKQGPDAPELTMDLYAYGWNYVGLWANAVRAIDTEVTGEAIKHALETQPRAGADPQFPLYSGTYSQTSHFHPGDPSDFTYGRVAGIKEGMFIVEHPKAP